MAGAGDDRASARRVAVVVVHGVGETTPGYALNELIDTMQREFPGELRADRHSELHPMSGPPLYAGDDADTFPAFARSAALPDTGERVRFYELYWADLTRVLPGRLNAFLGAFRIIFESHQFIDAMLPKDSGPLTRLLRRLLLIAAAILRGPIAALNICLIAIALVVYFGLALMRSVTDQTSIGPELMVWIVYGVTAVVAVATLLFFWRRWRRHLTEWNDVYVATFLGALFVGGFTWLLTSYPHVKTIVGRQFDSDNPVCSYVDRFFYITQSVWAFWSVVMAAALVVLGVLAVRRSKAEASRGAAEAAIGVVAMQSALWIALICIFALPMLRQAELSEGVKVCSLNNLFIFFAGAAGWSLVVGLVAFSIYAARWLLARAPMLSLERKSQLTPRMLFGGPIIFAIVVGVAINLVVFFIQFLNLFGETNQLLRSVSGLLVSSEHMTDLAEFVDKHRPKFYAATSALAVGAGALMAGNFTTAIHIARDLIDHQYSPRLGYSHYLLPPRGRRDVPLKPRRLRLRERLNALARELICPEGFDDVVFVVHSQGSVIAYDYLSTGGTECEQLLCAHPHLVTFGSPLGHLYEFYFGEYGSLQDGITALRPRLSSWTNLYRVDDYVGREIGEKAGGFVRNIVMPAGGHIDYWKERALAEVILERIRTPGTGAEPGPKAA